MPPCSCWTKAHLYSLESGGSFQRPPCTGGGEMGPAGHSYPEKKALSWADRSTVNTPHRGAKWFPFSGLFFFFFLRRALRGWAGWGQVWGSSWRVGARGGGVMNVWIRCCRSRHVTTDVHVHRHTHAVTLSSARLLRQYRFYLDALHPFTPTNILSTLSSFYCAEHIGMSCICHSSL